MLAAKLGMWLGRAMPPHISVPMAPPSQWHRSPNQPFPKSPLSPPPRCQACPVRVAGAGGRSKPCKGAFSSASCPPCPSSPCGCSGVLAHPPLWLLLVWPRCCFNFSNSLERVIFHNSACSEALCLPALPPHMCCWRAPAAHACTCPARPACPSLLHTKSLTPGSRPTPRFLGTSHPGTPKFRHATAGVGTLAWLHGHLRGFCLVSSRAQHRRTSVPLHV